MKAFLTIATIAALGLAGATQAADINGDWARGDGRARVKIAKCGADICATNTWIKPGTPSEKAGDVLVMKVKADADGNYAGSAFDPQRDMSYKITLTVKDSSMTSKGCVLGGLLCKGVNWTRLN
ncbi:DUF2147 domain-containing protein [Rhizobium sp. TH2]|uniref:DUF2147 domain-containing protein n=1 Tax=Rhizobium sp. TH2 TaxID=2775403 RepID=UPI0021575699|nr:DUF2147 domain-containing protein [Rhizobium sp. TH2]UVC09251.1 DUF2147 domain-containing protein [Rhizobium sp. TH2]